MQVSYRYSIGGAIDLCGRRKHVNNIAGARSLLLVDDASISRPSVGDPLDEGGPIVRHWTGSSAAVCKGGIALFVVQVSHV